MSTLRERFATAVTESAGLTDRELTDRLLGASVGQQAVNQVARALAVQGRITRSPRADGKIGNYSAGAPAPDNAPARLPSVEDASSGLSEDDVKRRLKDWLEADGWQAEVKWGRDRGIDIQASRGSEVWIIEAKGCGSLNAMRVNYFLGMLGETLQRMDNPAARYSIALPDMKQYRGLWARLPQLAKSRTQISVLLVAPDGGVAEVS